MTQTFSNCFRPLETLPSIVVNYEVPFVSRSQNKRAGHVNIDTMQFVLLRKIKNIRKYTGIDMST